MSGARSGHAAEPPDQRTRLRGRHVQPSRLTRRHFLEPAADTSVADHRTGAQLRPLCARQTRAAVSARPLPAAWIAGRYALLVRVVAGEQPGGSQLADAPLRRSEQETYSRQFALFVQARFQDDYRSRFQIIFLERTGNTVKLAGGQAQKSPASSRASGSRGTGCSDRLPVEPRKVAPQAAMACLRFWSILSRKPVVESHFWSAPTSRARSLVM